MGPNRGAGYVAEGEDDGLDGEFDRARRQALQEAMEEQLQRERLLQRDRATLGDEQAEGLAGARAREDERHRAEMDAAVDASLADEDERERVELAKAASLDGAGSRRSGRLAARRDSSGSIELDHAGREVNRGDAEDDAAGWGGAGAGFDDVDGEIEPW